MKRKESKKTKLPVAADPKKKSTPWGWSTCLTVLQTMLLHRLPFQGDWPMSKCYSSKHWVLCIRTKRCCFFFFFLRQICFFTDCLPLKTYQFAWENQSWGDSIPDQWAILACVVCDAYKTPAVITKAPYVLALELFVIVCLFFLSPWLIPALLPSLYCCTSISQYKACSVLVWVQVL